MLMKCHEGSVEHRLSFGSSCSSEETQPVDIMGVLAPTEEAKPLEDVMPEEARRRYQGAPKTPERTAEGDEFTPDAKVGIDSIGGFCSHITYIDFIDTWEPDIWSSREH